MSGDNFEKKQTKKKESPGTSWDTAMQSVHPFQAEGKDFQMSQRCDMVDFLPISPYMRMCMQAHTVL